MAIANCVSENDIIEYRSERREKKMRPVGKIYAIWSLSESIFSSSLLLLLLLPACIILWNCTACRRNRVVQKISKHILFWSFSSVQEQVIGYIRSTPVKMKALRSFQRYTQSNAANIQVSKVKKRRNFVNDSWKVLRIIIVFHFSLIYYSRDNFIGRRNLFSVIFMWLK